MNFIIRGAVAVDTDPLGGKARALAALRKHGLPIPEWFVVAPEAFSSSNGALPPDVLGDLTAALTEMGSVDSLFAVRSSASDEDGAQHSFAGQLDTFLFVPPDAVAGKILEVWQSGFSERIMAYRREHRLDGAARPPSALIQRMVNADVAGVAFGADPVSGRRGVAVVSAVYGLGTALVSGDVDADTYHIDRDGAIQQRAIADKRFAHRAAAGSSEGVAAVPVPDDLAKKPALSDDQALAVADLVRRCGDAFGRPQDIEWAIEGGKLYLLQSRPITSLAAIADPDGLLNLWDNSNIAESYNGVTTPLTFSFARRAYEEVYRQFCKILRVPADVIEANDEIFRHMLGLIRGQIYYNLLNWYRLLTMLPGFKANRGFMEQMMGVKEPLPEHLIADLTKSTWRERWRDRLRLFGSVAAMVGNHFRLPRQIEAFYRRLENALGSPAAVQRARLERARPDELVAHYRALERQLLTRWDAPLVNDFFAMIFYGVLGKLTTKWCGDSDSSLQNDLLCGEGGMISAEPAARVRQLAELATSAPPLASVLATGSLEQIREQMTRSPDFRARYAEYLDKFGDRCLEELKLESATLHDDPLTLLRSIGQYASRLQTAAPPVSETAEVRCRAERRGADAMSGHPVRRRLFAWVLRHARARVRDRENLRFERTRLFGRVRTIFVELGKRLFSTDVLADPRDIFYLEVDEALGFVDGTTATADLKALVAVRKAEFQRYRDGTRPDDRFETHGAVHQGNAFRGAPQSAAVLSGDSRKGLGCCPGVVRGAVRVITDPRNATLTMGDILVAERTDPGWIMLFPSAAGLLVERGSLLSHSAIVAREMGIPAIVSIPDVTRWLKDGDWVELDGKTGIVTRIEKTEADHGK